MIATVTGLLAAREGETVVIQTDGGVGYAVTVPLGVFERLPEPGARVSLYTELVVREDGWSLFGFDRAADRTVFQRLLGASGFGPRLALALLSALGPDRNVDRKAVRPPPGCSREAYASATPRRGRPRCFRDCRRSA